MEDVCDISGIWLEADRYFVKIDQEGELFTAVCSYRRADGVDVVWHADGTVGRNRLDCELTHICPQSFYSQKRRATIVDDRIVGTVFVDGIMHGRFDWERSSILDMHSRVPGPLSFNELNRLMQEASRVGEFGGHIVEVGRLFGKSSMSMAYELMISGSNEKVFSIDSSANVLANDELLGVEFECCTPLLPDEMKGLSCGEIYEHYTAGVRQHIVRVDGDSKYILPKVLNGASIVFIDGDHSYEGAKEDIRLTLKCKTLKTLMCHDWVNPNPNIQVRKACDEVLGEPDEVVDSMAIWNTR